MLAHIELQRPLSELNHGGTRDVHGNRGKEALINKGSNYVRDL